MKNFIKIIQLYLFFSCYALLASTSAPTVQLPEDILNGTAFQTLLTQYSTALALLIRSSTTYNKNNSPIYSSVHMITQPYAEVLNAYATIVLNLVSNKINPMNALYHWNMLYTDYEKIIATLSNGMTSSSAPIGQNSVEQNIFSNITPSATVLYIYYQSLQTSLAKFFLALQSITINNSDDFNVALFLYEKAMSLIIASSSVLTYTTPDTIENELYEFLKSKLNAITNLLYKAMQTNENPWNTYAAIQNLYEKTVNALPANQYPGIVATYKNIKSAVSSCSNCATMLQQYDHQKEGILNNLSLSVSSQVLNQKMQELQKLMKSYQALEVSWESAIKLDASLKQIVTSQIAKCDNSIGEVASIINIINAKIQWNYFSSITTTKSSTETYSNYLMNISQGKGSDIAPLSTVIDTLLALLTPVLGKSTAFTIPNYITAAAATYPMPKPSTTTTVNKDTTLTHQDFADLESVITDMQTVAQLLALTNTDIQAIAKGQNATMFTNTMIFPQIKNAAKNIDATINKNPKIADFIYDFRTLLSNGNNNTFEQFFVQVLYSLVFENFSNLWSHLSATSYYWSYILSSLMMLRHNHSYLTSVQIKALDTLLISMSNAINITTYNNSLYTAAQALTATGWAWNQDNCTALSYWNEVILLSELRVHIGTISNQSAEELNTLKSFYVAYIASFITAALEQGNLANFSKQTGYQWYLYEAFYKLYATQSWWTIATGQSWWETLKLAPPSQLISNVANQIYNSIFVQLGTLFNTITSKTQSSTQQALLLTESQQNLNLLQAAVNQEAVAQYQLTLLGLSNLPSVLSCAQGTSNTPENGISAKFLYQAKFVMQDLKLTLSSFVVIQNSIVENNITDANNNAQSAFSAIQSEQDSAHIQTALQAYQNLVSLIKQTYKYVSKDQQVTVKQIYQLARTRSYILTLLGSLQLKSNGGQSEDLIQLQSNNGYNPNYLLLFSGKYPKNPFPIYSAYASSKSPNNASPWYDSYVVKNSALVFNDTIISQGYAALFNNQSYNQKSKGYNSFSTLILSQLLYTILSQNGLNYANYFNNNSDAPQNNVLNSIMRNNSWLPKNNSSPTAINPLQINTSLAQKQYNLVYPYLMQLNELMGTQFPTNALISEAFSAKNNQQVQGIDLSTVGTFTPQVVVESVSTQGTTAKNSSSTETIYMCTFETLPIPAVSPLYPGGPTTANYFYVAGMLAEPGTDLMQMNNTLYVPGQDQRIANICFNAAIKVCIASSLAKIIGMQNLFETIDYSNYKQAKNLFIDAQISLNNALDYAIIPQNSILQNIIALQSQQNYATFFSSALQFLTSFISKNTTDILDPSFIAILQDIVSVMKMINNFSVAQQKNSKVSQFTMGSLGDFFNGIINACFIAPKIASQNSFLATLITPGGPYMHYNTAYNYIQLLKGIDDPQNDGMQNLIAQGDFVLKNGKTFNTTYQQLPTLISLMAAAQDLSMYIAGKTGGYSYESVAETGTGVQQNSPKSIQANFQQLQAAYEAQTNTGAVDAYLNVKNELLNIGMKVQNIISDLSSENIDETVQATYNGLSPQIATCVNQTPIQNILGKDLNITLYNNDNNGSCIPLDNPQEIQFFITQIYSCIISLITQPSGYYDIYSQNYFEALVHTISKAIEYQYIIDFVIPFDTTLTPGQQSLTDALPAGYLAANSNEYIQAIAAHVFDEQNPALAYIG